MKKNEVFRITSTKGDGFDFEMPPSSRIESFFPFALPKSGSSLLNNMLILACRDASVSAIDIPSISFEKGIRPKDLDSSISQVFKDNGFAYLGWRYFPEQSGFDFSNARCILLIRDPRDMMTSLYFSQAKSHKIPEVGLERENSLRKREMIASMNINDWACQNHETFIKLFKSYAHGLPDTTRIYRYEDVIFRKMDWLGDICRFVGLNLSDNNIVKIATAYDVRPNKENPNAHVRQVTPGNYKKHFTADTIKFLNEQFSEILSMYGYDREIAEGEPICFSDPSSREYSQPVLHENIVSLQ